MSQSSSMHSLYSSTSHHWQYDQENNDDADISQSLDQLEKQRFDQQQEHLNRTRLLKERESGNGFDQPHYQRTRTISRTEDSNYTKATSSSRSRAAATAAEKAGTGSITRKRLSTRDPRYPSITNQRPDYDTISSESSEVSSSTISSKSSGARQRRPSAAAHFAEKDRDFLLRSASLQTRRVSDAQLVIGLPSIICSVKFKQIF
jgi:hypothetical protein